MADRVREVMESMVPELEDVQRRGLCSASEVKALVRRRERFEYLVHRRAPLAARWPGSAPRHHVLWPRIGPARRATTFCATCSSR